MFPKWGVLLFSNLKGKLVLVIFKSMCAGRLPGRTLAKGQSIWLNNAHSADCKIFSRSLLAKVDSVS